MDNEQNRSKPTRVNNITRKTTLSTTTNGLSGPLVGEPWPELKREDVSWPDANGIGFNYSSKKRSMSVKIQIKTHALLLTIFAVVLGYAVARNDRVLIQEVLSAIGTHETPHTTESPPSDRSKVQRY